MNVYSVEVVFQEVPGEVSLGFTISGCQLKCKGCHSRDSWNVKRGERLSLSQFNNYLDTYRNLITCVVFFGGEWHEKTLIELLMVSTENGLNTCLYTGEEHLSASITQHLTYLKTGPWIRNLGGLDCTTTNQRFIHVPSNTNLNDKFIR